MKKKEAGQSTKICCTCGKEYPKTHEYFFAKKEKQLRATGKIKVYHNFRSDCKVCHGKKNEKRRLKKRYKELNCDAEGYRDAWINEIRKKHIKYDALLGLGLKQSEINYIRKKIDEGYNFTTLDQYERDKQKNIRDGQLKHRKYKYNTDDLLTVKEINAMAIKHMPKSRIALKFRVPVKELPDEIYESAKLVIQIKRELGLTRPYKKNSLT